jgi:FecR protein
MRRTGGKLIAKSLAFWLAVGLGFFGVSVPRWPLAAELIVAHEAWQVLEKSGSVRYQAPGGAYSWQAATGSEIPPGSRIVTDRSGWVIVRRAGEVVRVQPSARFVLPSAETAHRVRQEAGDLRYWITPGHRFEVETPYASLVVKGTVFDIEVGEAGAAVEVERGLVEVATPRGARADLQAGQAARVGAGAQASLEVRSDPCATFTAVQPDRRVTPAGARGASRDNTGKDGRGTQDDEGNEGGKVSQAGKGNKSGKSTQGGSDSKGNKDEGNDGKSSGRCGGGSSGGGGGGSGGSGRN